MLRAVGTGLAGLGVTIASTFAPSLGLTLQQQRIGFAIGMVLVLVGAVLFFRGHQTLADKFDALMHEGMALLDELMAPAQAEETSAGTSTLEFGDAPAEWLDKADAFYKKIRDLLIAENPALLPDLERGFNQRLRIQRESKRRAPVPDERSNAQKTLDFATETQRTPARIVEACLEGLSQARKAI